MRRFCHLLNDYFLFGTIKYLATPQAFDSRWLGCISIDVLGSPYFDCRKISFALPRIPLCTSFRWLVMVFYIFKLTDIMRLLLVSDNFGLFWNRFSRNCRYNKQKQNLKRLSGKPGEYSEFKWRGLNINLTSARVHSYYVL